MHADRQLSDLMNGYLRLFDEQEIQTHDVKGSTDMADVSVRIPAIHTWVGLGCPELSLHTREFAERTITAAGDTFLLRSSKALACTALAVLNSDYSAKLR